MGRIIWVKKNLYLFLVKELKFDFKLSRTSKILDHIPFPISFVISLIRKLDGDCMNVARDVEKDGLGRADSGIAKTRFA